ncbi:MAG TPA: DUF1150 family protein [Acetobacteraceae bacterium]|jgi:hypothetical protein|nr:DUF1150 family protein [Acetobacteraceae bacterium]
MNTDRQNSTDDSTEQLVMPVNVDIRHISAEQLAELGVARIAYVKPVEVNGTQGFAIHAANGTPMALTGGLDVAMALIVQHEMVPALVH